MARRSTPESEPVAIESELRDLIENIPAMVFIALPGPSNAFASRGWREYTGMSGEDTAGTGWRSVVHPEDLERHTEKWRVCSATGGSFEDEARFRRAADGEYRWFLVRAVPLRDGQGDVLKWYGVLTDIEDRKRAEQASGRTEQALRDVIETIPVMAFSARTDGVVDFVNRRHSEYWGFSGQPVSPSDWQSRVHPDDRKRVVSKWAASLASGEPLENEFRRRSASGEYRWFSVRAVPQRDGQGKILKWYGTLTDVEDRKRAEASLRGEKRILEMVAKGDSLAQILDGLCRLVEEQASGVLASILLIDDGRVRHGGAPSLPKAYVDAIDGVLIGPSAGSCGTAAYRGQQVIVEDIATDPLWTDYRAAALPHSLRACWSTPVFSSQGKVVATFAMYYREPRRPGPRDQEIIEQITNLAGVAIERRTTQEALRRSEAYLAEAQRLSRTGSWAYDPAREKAIYWSEEMYRVFGMEPRRGSAPDHAEFIRLVHPEDRDRFDERVGEAFRNQVNYAVDYRIVLPDGTLKHLHEIGHPILDEAGKVVEWIGTEVDVTDRKRADAERERLRQLEADLAHVSRVSMMGELAASLTHEIKQPIAATATNASAGLRWLQREAPDIGEARETLSRILKDANRAAEIIDRNRSLYARDTPTRAAVDLNELVREMIVLLHDAAHRHFVSIGTALDPELPRITADRVQLQQVLMNLMLNGVEAMKGAGGALTIRSERSQAAQVLLSVTDSGIGLPTGNVERVFDAFFTTKADGTGMGLSISRRIIESHGGRLWASANPGPGATFQFTLPADPSPSLPPAA